MLVALAVSEFTEELLAYKRNSLHLLHPGFPLVALYKESNLLTLFKSDINRGHREMERKGRTEHRDYSS